jgi:hypothetical protein
MRPYDLFDPSFDDAPTLPMRRGSRRSRRSPMTAEAALQTIIIAPEPPSVPSLSSVPSVPASEPENIATREPDPTFVVDRTPRRARARWFAFGALFVLSASWPWVNESLHGAVAAGNATRAERPPCVVLAAFDRITGASPRVGPSQ